MVSLSLSPTQGCRGAPELRTKEITRNRVGMRALFLFVVCAGAFFAGTTTRTAGPTRAGTSSHGKNREGPAETTREVAEKTRELRRTLLDVDKPWQRLKDMPVKLAEGSALVVGKEVWAIGGLAGAGKSADRAWIYDTEADTWREGPLLPHRPHHLFDSTWFSGGRIVAVGGIKQEKCFKVGSSCSEASHAIYAYTLPPADSNVSSYSNETFEVVPSAISAWGGVTTCSPWPIDGLRYCYAGDHGVFTGKANAGPFKFYSIHEETLTVRFLPAPSVSRDHVGMIVDFERRRIYMSGGHQILEWGGNKPAVVRTTTTYDAWLIDEGVWEESVFAAPFEPIECRAVIQIPGQPCVVIAGGQEMLDTVKKGPGLTGLVSDAILQFHIPSLTWRYVGEVPHPFFGAGSAVIGDNSGSASAFLTGGSIKVGHHSWPRAYKWNMGNLLRERFVGREYWERTKVHVVSALCDSYLVTDEVAALVNEHQNKLISDRTRWDDWVAGKHIPLLTGEFCTEIAATGAIAGSSIPFLTVTFIRHNRLFVQNCFGPNVCLVDAFTTHREDNDDHTMVNVL
mmetsp:Transcript_26200/g.73428  ORF Transcript_26200/g.73428 Transcript_26200/m.73428 type:complete len:567 (+) Transcript_26200:149-1849(+)